MQTISVSEFRAKLQQFLEMAQQGKSLVITNRGEKIAVVTSPKTQMKKSRLKLKKLAEDSKIGNIEDPIPSQWKLN